MKRRVAGRWAVLSIPLAAAVLLASPASAHVATGYADSFYGQCDGNVTISDELIGSPGKIEAWGGFACPSKIPWAGQMTLQVFKNGVKVSEVKKSANGTTDHIDATLTNSAGTQRWRAQLTLFRPGFASTIISTGEIPS